MKTSALKHLGLTENEIKIYLSLIELGTTTSGPLARHSGLHTSRVYESIERLIEKGIVSYSLKSNKKHYTAADPSVLTEIAEQEKKELQTLVPQLKLLHKKSTEEEKAAFFEGYRGVRSVFDSIPAQLKKGDCVYVLGARKEQESFMSKTYFKEYTKRRVKKGIKMKMLFNADAKETGRYFEKLKHTQVKYLPGGYNASCTINIFGDNVATLILNPSPRIFVITSGQASDSYKELFKMIWKTAC